jgi:predicted nucleic acid-binding protein
MTDKYVIDTSAWIEYFSGTKLGKKVQPIIEKAEIGTSFLAIAELADKFTRSGKEIKQPLDIIRSKAALLQLSTNICLNAGSLKNKIREKKPKFGLTDALHLATAIDEKAILVTTDNDFQDTEHALVIN